MHAQGYLSSPYLPTYYELAQRHADVPRLSDKQVDPLNPQPYPNYKHPNL